MGKISGYAANAVPGDSFELIGTDPANTSMAASGTTETVSVLALLNDQAPARMHGLRGAGGITKTMAALAQADKQLVSIPWIGDSLTAGHGTDGFAAGWAERLALGLRWKYARSATGGLGFIPLYYSSTGTTYTWPVVPATGTNPADYQGADVGPVRNAMETYGTCTFTYTAPAGCTSVKIMYFDVNTAGVFSYKVGSGAATNVSNTATGAEILTADIPLTAGQVLTIAWVSGVAVVDGIFQFSGDESAGVQVSPCGNIGWNASTGADGWNAAEPNGFDWMQCYAKFPGVVPAIGIMLGANDATTYTASQFQANLQNFITALRADTSIAALNNSTGVDILLGIEPDPTGTQTITDAGGWPAYVAASRAIAVANAHTAVFDFGYRLAGPATDIDGLYNTTTAPDHWNDAGAALAGAAGAALLGAA